MPTNISGRVTTILVVLLLSLWAIFPSGNIFKPDLKPGIDMVGGTSLLYEVKAAPGASSVNLAEQVMEALKKRVDPDGVRNLIWRPQGNTRLEIQLPLTAKSEQAEQARAAFAAAQQNLEKTNINTGQAIYEIKTLKGTERAERIKALSAGSETRATVLGALATTVDQIEAAAQSQNAVEQARLEQQQDKLIGQLTDTNLTINQLQLALELKAKDAREQKIAAFKRQSADFPDRLKAIDAFVEAYDAYSKVKGTIGDASDLKRLLRGSGVLEFHILAFNRLPSGGLTLAPELSDDQYKAYVERLQTRGPQMQAGDELRWFVVERPAEFGFPTVELNEKHYALAFVTPEKSLAHGQGKPKWALQAAYPETSAGELKVGFNFDARGSQLFGELTSDNVHRPLAIVLDERIISAPDINQPIYGSGVISGGRGGFTKAEMDYLVRTLTAGALPAQLTDEPISERQVGPQLGADNLRRGLYACYFGLFVVAVFLIGYYYLSGVVAMVAVAMNMVLILGAMAALNATFTLPGIAGIVLTIGMAVDANVLIFERLREEQLRGLSLRMALRNAYDRAFYAIFDSNVTTAITAAALYIFGSEEVRGFGLTLLLGILSSMFTALFVTKTIFAVLIDKFGIPRLGSLPLTIPTWDKMLKPNIDWMSKAWIFYAFSTVFIVGGLVAFGVKWAQGRMLDIEFASGTAVQFELKQPMPIDALRKMIEETSRNRPVDLPAPGVVAVGEGDRTYEVVTPNKDAPAVKKAILDTLADQLNISVPSHFDLAESDIAAAMQQTVFPIEPDTNLVGRMAPKDLRSAVGGVAIVLKNLTPPLPAVEIEKRIQQQRLQPQTGSNALRRFPQIFVEGNAKTPTEPSTQAVVMAVDPDLPYDPANPIKAQQWTDELAGPVWALVCDAVNKPAELQKVTNFDAQVASETQRQALIALAVSIFAVMAYIWIRFGNLKYGTATVVALLHDALFTLAAVGVAHYIANTTIGDLLLIEPFRVNLNLVAAVLTVMGYSMNDTVVVFDRIRENRGKFGHVDRNVINDSINQTLSRTLLTGGTTILTIFMMYIYGGAGIHGFTFALLVGIVVGTYSSIAIASPILLVGQAQLAQGGSAAFGVGQRQLQKA